MKFNKKEIKILAIFIAVWGLFFIGSGIVMKNNKKITKKTNYRLIVKKSKKSQAQAKKIEVILKDIEIEINNPISVNVKDYLVDGDKIDDKIITCDDIDTLVIKKLGDSRDLTFAFTKSLAERDKKDALIKFRELLAYNIEPISLIGLLASQIRIIYQVKIFNKEHYSDKEIQEMLEEKTTYRIKKTRELIHYYTEKELLQMMQQLHEMDLKLKTSDVDGIGLIEMFIINM